MCFNVVIIIIILFIYYLFIIICVIILASFWQYGKSYASGHLQMKFRKYGSMTTTYKHKNIII